MFCPVSEEDGVMSTTTSRELHLLELLQSSGTRTLRELAERLDVDERTVRRYIEDLRNMDVPVESVRGRYGGYRIGQGFRMPPLMLSDDEALAVVLGLLHAQADPGASGPAVQTAMAKVRRSLPARAADRLDVLSQAATFTVQDPAPVPDADVMLTVAEAVHDGRPLEIRYHSASGAPSRRVVHPHELVSYQRRWYLIAVDTARDADRTFRVDRIATARTLPGTVPPPETPGTETTGTSLAERFARADHRWTVILHVHTDMGTIRAQLPESVAMVRPSPADGRPDADRYRVEIHAAHLDWIPPVIAALGCPVEVESPSELRTLLVETAARLTDAAADGSSHEPLRDDAELPDTSPS
jgi:predicted DNA-binding transcriptional regulator YafY